jgi:xylulokinase
VNRASASGLFLGIDIGTSGVKAVVLSDSGEIVAQETAALSISRPQPMWSEQAPRDWWNACNAAVLAIDPALRAGVQAIGLTGQMHGAVLLDAQDNPLRPAILWNDGRSHEECAELESRAPESRAITGNIAMPGFTAPKLLWIARHEPDVFAATQLVLLPKDYIRLLLTGDKASDMSDAAGTLWLDTGARAWSEAMLEATGLSLSHMPRLFEGSEASGTLRQEIAGEWGMSPVPVAAGGGDNAAGAVGVGVLKEGDAMLSLGTSGVTFVANARFSPNPESAVHAFCHCLPQTWHQMAVHLSAASCVDWAVRQFGLPGPAEFFALAETVEPGSGPELFLPFLSGERTPHNDPHLRAGFLRCDGDTDVALMASAVLEGVAFAHADGLAALRDAGSQIERLSVIGGGSRSLHWGRILAAVLDAELAYLDGGDVGPALGAARLARLALTGEEPGQVCTAPPIRAMLSPDARLAGTLAPKLASYRAACRAIRFIEE